MMQNVEILVEMLEASGVRWVFGVPSGPVLALMDALRRSSIDFVLTASESSAGFMAATVGHLTGAPGVCVATVGPGATNLTTGIGAAWLDRAPALAITCNVATPWLDRRIQMRIDHQALFRPLTKATFGLRTDNLVESVAEALRIALAEPPGPVHLDLPEDVSIAEAAQRSTPRQAALATTEPIGDVAEAVAAALAGARRPLLVTGLGITRSAAAGSLLAFAEQQHLPFVTTMHAKGWLPESHPNWCGVVGRARRTDVQRFVNQTDLILAVGFDPIEINYEEWAGATPVVHVSTETADNAGAINFVANRAVALDDAIRALAALPPTSNDWQPHDFATHRATFDRALRAPSAGFPLHEVLDLLRARLPHDAILAYDVGAHTHQIASQWRTDLPDTALGTNGWSSMGFGMPAAYAAKLVHPDRHVVAIVGDGGFQMTAGELAMARRLGLRVPVIVLNDGWLGLMKVKQERRKLPSYGVELGEPPPPPTHYFGVPCRGAANGEELADALEWAFGLDGPSVIEARIDAEAYSQTVYD
ncbi:MAG: acetolactate synthase large subunit [Chloroflexota bacterium]|jgi:acetolactate synthase-1/2/3 large subunit|nr:acetolactate synthase large subunit [Chloroflexota bacterium]